MSIYQQYYKESFDTEGRLLDVDIQYPDNFNFGYDVVDQLAAEYPEKRALVWCNTANEAHVFTFADIREESNRAANVLLEAGIGRGDRVMLALKRHYEYWIIAIALHKIGAVMIPVTHMLTVEDFVYRLQASQARAVICTTQNGVPDRLQEAVHVAQVDCQCWTLKENVPGFRCFTTAMEKASTTLTRRETASHDPMMIYFTSGTTGYPKGVMHDFTYPLAHYVTAKYWQGVRPNGLHFTVAETGWAKASWGKLYGQWLNECAVMVYDFDNFEPKQMEAIMKKYNVTSFCAPPTIYRYMMRKGTKAFPSLEHISTAGEYLSPDIFNKVKDITGLELMEGYGQTETTLLAANFIGTPAKDASLGKPSPLYQIEIHREDGTCADIGEVGEIVVLPKDGKRPVGIFCGYLDDEARYQQAWRGNVYHTGDAAHQDEEGYLWFHSRFDDVIKSGGFRIGPYEIENVLVKHPAVFECSVIGIPDPFRGQSIKAIVTLVSGTKPSHALEREIRDFCNSRLAEYKWVRDVEIVDNMIKTTNGKIKKASQRQKYGMKA